MGENIRFRASLLDRLLMSESDPDTPVFGLSEAEYMTNVQRDLQDLLNTRQGITEADLSAFDEARKSLLTYGFPELSSSQKGEAGIERRVAEGIVQAIKSFEPRLSQVRVTPVEGTMALGQFRFRVEANARAEPQPARVVFDSTMDLQQQHIRFGEEE